MIQKKGNIVATFFKLPFAADVDISLCLHATPSNGLFCTHYVGNVIYHNLHTVIFPMGSVEENIDVMLDWAVFSI